jgi:PBP1b-binding outer membrane lipoprotein LpoB
MKLKSIISLILVTVFLAGCASTQKQMVDGKEREVFVSSTGTYAKDGATMSDFNSANHACQQVAFKDGSGKNLDRLIPFNIKAEQRWILAVMDQTSNCLQAAGFIFVEHSKQYQSIKSKLASTN